MNTPERLLFYLFAVLAAIMVGFGLILLME